MKLPDLVLPTRCAHWGWDEHRYWGHAVFGELTGHESFTGLTALSILGRQLSPECCALLDDAAMAQCLADPRIWPLKLTRLVASYGHTVPAVAAALLIQEDARIGPWSSAKAADTLSALRVALAGRLDDADWVLDVVKKQLQRDRFLWGFGTPFRSRDERLVAFRECIRRRGRDQLEHWRVLDAVAVAVRRLRKVEPNMGAGIAAALLDIGLTSYEIGVLTVSMATHMFFANAVEEARRSPPALRQLPGPYVTFGGRAPRISARAEVAATAGAAPPRAGAHAAPPDVITGHR